MSQPDWEAIERAYRAGSLSVRAIAEKHGTSESTIRSRATRNGWQRDLTEQVKTATKTKLSRKVSRTTVAHAQVREDAQIVDEASDEAADVVLGHREDLSRWRRLANKLGDVLDEMGVDESNHSEYARSLNAGVDAQLKLIKGEREAYNLGSSDDDKTVQTLSDLMDNLATEA